MERVLGPQLSAFVRRLHEEHGVVFHLEETVTVTSSSELINTQTATVSATLNSDQLMRMPTPTRNALNTITFLPGVNTPGTNRDSTINGLPEGFVSITLDGVSNNDNFLRSTDSFFASVTPRQDAVEAAAKEVAAAHRDDRAEAAVERAAARGLHHVDAVRLLDLLLLLALHRARGVGDVGGAVDERGDAGARAAAGDLDLLVERLVLVQRVEVRGRGHVGDLNTGVVDVVLDLDLAPEEAQPVDRIEVGGLAVAVASDEANNGSGRFDEWKRQRLLGVGADVVIPDFRDAEVLLTNSPKLLPALKAYAAALVAIAS